MMNILIRKVIFYVKRDLIHLVDYLISNDTLNDGVNIETRVVDSPVLGERKKREM